MKITIRELRRIIRNVIIESTQYMTRGFHTPDDMNRILQYGGELGLDDGTGESGGDENINEFTSHRRAVGSPTMRLTNSWLQNDPENSDEDFPAEPNSYKNELFEPGYQDTQRYINAGSDDFDGPSKINEENDAWNMCLNLFDKLNFQSMSDPEFINDAIYMLKQNGIKDGTLVKIQFKLENQQ